MLVPSALCCNTNFVRLMAVRHKFMNILDTLWGVDLRVLGTSVKLSSNFKEGQFLRPLIIFIDFDFNQTSTLPQVQFLLYVPYYPL